MEIFRFISVKLVLGLITGILLGYFLSPPLFFSFLLVGGGLLILGILFSSKKQIDFPYFAILSSILTISIGCLTFSISQPENRFDHYSHISKDRNSTWHIKVREVLKPTSFSDRYIAIIKGIDGRKASGKMVINVPSDYNIHRFKIDDELMIFTQPQAIKPPLNPHQFNYKKYLRNLGITDQMSLTATNFVGCKSPTTTFYGTTANLRNKISDKLRRSNFGEAQLGIIQALVLGQRNDILKETYDDYKNAGAVHILAVSGLHIGIILLLLQFLLKPLERLPHGKTIKMLLIVLLLWGFAFLAGLSASIIRAVTMFSFLAYALFLNRPTNTFNILALSMFFILLVHPMFLFQVGFQMSYAAVFAISWIYPLLQKVWSSKNILLRRGWQLISVSMAAQLGVLPISLFYFHQFPGLFFVSNLLIIPFLGILLGMGILVILLALLNILPSILVYWYDSLIGSMNSLVGWVAEHETFIFRDIPFDTEQLILAYLIIICIIEVCTKINFKKTSALLLAIICFQCWSIFIQYRTKNKEDFVVLHQSKNTIMLYQSGSRLNVFTTDSSRIHGMITNFRVAENIGDINYLSLKNNYHLGNKKVVIIDSLAVYPISVRPDYILLTQSPKINLDRVLNTLRPKIVISDGNNYRSYVERWKASCEKAEIAFHYTGHEGACHLFGSR